MYGLCIFSTTPLLYQSEGVYLLLCNIKGDNLLLANCTPCDRVMFQKRVQNSVQNASEKFFPGESKKFVYVVFLVNFSRDCILYFSFFKFRPSQLFVIPIATGKKKTLAKSRRV